MSKYEIIEFVECQSSQERKEEKKKGLNLQLVSHMDYFYTSYIEFSVTLDLTVYNYFINMSL